MSVNVKKVVTEIVAIVDRSGSMESIKQDAIGGFNSFLEGQKAQKGKATFTLVQFDDQIDVVCSGIPVADATPYTNSTYTPRGMTALYDAISRGIGEASKRGEDRQVIIAILTDGMENSSKEATMTQVQGMIAKYESLGWAFIFLAAGFSQFEAEKMAYNIGIKSSNAMGVSRGQLDKVYSCATTATSSYRSSGSIGVNWRK